MSKLVAVVEAKEVVDNPMLTLMEVDRLAMEMVVVEETAITHQEVAVVQVTVS